MSKTVLMVDDSKAILSLMRNVLDMAGYNVLTASDGEEGLKILNSDKRVDIIITDLNMPNMDGITFIWEIRKISKYMFTPICMLTTETEQSKLENDASISTEAWITKPVQPARVIDIVNGILPP